MDDHVEILIYQIEDGLTKVDVNEDNLQERCMILTSNGPLQAFPLFQSHLPVALRTH